MQQANGLADSRQTFDRRRTEEDFGLEDVELDLARLVFTNLVPVVLQGTAYLIGLSAFFAHHYGDRWMGGMAVVMFCICAVRIAIVLGFLRRDSPALTVLEAWRWQLAYAVSTFLYCSSMAAVTVHCLRHHDLGSWAICSTGVFALSANLSCRPGLRPVMAQANPTIMLAALAVPLLFTEDLLVRIAGMLVAAFAVLHCAMIRSQFAAVVEQIRSHRKLIQLAEQDGLTGLANRRHFQAAVASACLQVARPFAILYIDLDRFKAVNDTFGHATGDILLQQVARRIQNATRSYDVVARLGGDEFAVLQQAAVTVQDAEALASRIVRDLATFFEIEGRRVAIGASIGIRLSANQEIDPLLLLSKADHALYRVKQSGGGGFALTES